MSDDVAHPPRTSVPRWGGAAPALSARATEYTLFSVGSEHGTVRRWSGELSARGVTHEIVTVAGTELAAWLDTCDRHVRLLAATRCVGWRIAVAGEEAGVLAVAAAARRAGLIDAEITAFAETRRHCVVYCTHCKATMLVPAGPGATVDCRGCHRALRVRAHVSREAGTYLGVAVG